jgi:uncharacterized membrane protein
MTRLILILAALAAVMAWTPKWTRPDLFFAVTVGTGFSSTPQGRRILHRYWLEIALHTLIAGCLAVLVGIERSWAALPAIVWMVLGTGWAAAHGHRATLHHAVDASPVREAMLSSRPEKMPGGWLLAAGPLLFIGAAAVYAWVFWDDLPQRIAVHWGVDGADRWIDRTPLNVSRFLALLGSLCASLLLLSYGTLRWSRTISVAGDRARGESRFRRRTIGLLIGVQYLVVVPAVGLSFWPAMPAARLWPALCVALIVGSLLMLFRMGQGGSRVAGPAAYEPPVGDHTPDAAWKWGLIYYNPDDPALIVEKRFGLGYTFNFANRWSWLLMVAILLPAALAMMLR